MAKGVKTGGREQGTPNRLTQELRDVLKGIIDNELQHLPERLDKLDDRQRLDVVLKLLPYILPRVEQVAHWAGEPSQWDDVPIFR